MPDSLEGADEVKPAPFKLLRPHELDEVCAGLTEYGDEARLLAGGQSLVPTMNFRLAQPTVLIDLALVSGLDSIEVHDGELRVGAMVRQRSAERDPVVGAEAPMMTRALPFVGHVQNRNRGTIGGSIAHADPAAELPAVALAVDASLLVMRGGGERTIEASRFLDGPFMTTLEPGEVIAELRIPRRPNALVAVYEIARRHGDFAIAGVALSIETLDDQETVHRARLAVFGVAPNAIRLDDVESLLVGSVLDSSTIRSASRAASTALDRITDDNLASADYRRDALGVLVARALVDVAEQSRVPRNGQN
jgi:carbon-monoxide dehydrogenase medium subunit